MKPSKNRVFCKDCGKTKMFFETEKKADNFIKFNGEEIMQESGFKPERSYFCIYCGGWHLTSQKENLNIKSRTERVVDRYLEDTEKLKLQENENALKRAENQDKFEETLSFLEKTLHTFFQMEENSKEFNETLQIIITEFEKIKNYKGIKLKGSNKRFRDVKEKIGSL